MQLMPLTFMTCLTGMLLWLHSQKKCLIFGSVQAPNRTACEWKGLKLLNNGQVIGRCHAKISIRGEFPHQIIIFFTKCLNVYGLDSIKNLPREIKGNFFPFLNPILVDFSNNMMFLLLSKKAFNKISNRVALHPIALPKTQTRLVSHIPIDALLKDWKPHFNATQFEERGSLSGSSDCPH
ncbi:hypothetical protein ACJW31_01G053900 [Castanea mollissima]